MFLLFYIMPYNIMLLHFHFHIIITQAHNLICKSGSTFFRKKTEKNLLRLKSKVSESPGAIQRFGT